MPNIIKSYEECRDSLAKGWIIAYPTETLFGLGVNPLNEDAVNNLNKIKNRSPKSSYILLMKDLEMVSKYADIKGKEEFLNMVWPGPVSLVLKANNKLPKWIIDNKGNACFRVSSSKFVNELFEYIDRPLISTSANPGNLPPAKNVLEISSYFQNQERFAIHPDKYNEVQVGVSSTIINLTSTPPRVVRKGAFSIVF